MRAPARHVVHVIARLNVGGPAAILEVLTAADGSATRHTVLAGRLGRGEADWGALRGTDLPSVPVAGLTPALAPAADVAAIASVRRLLRQLRPDVVHTHTAKGGLVGRIAARSLGIPTVHTFHGHVLHGYFSPAVTRAYTAIERSLAPRTTRLLSVGRRVGEELLAAGIGRAEQYRTVEPAVAPPQPWDRADARRQLGLTQEEPVVLVLGRLTAVKRVDRAVDAVAALRASGREATLVVAGGGELTDELRRRAVGAGIRARFLGWVADVGLPLAAADVALLSSDNEGMPVGLVESALAGLPAVATDVGSVGEVVEDGRTGLLVAPDADALAAALGRLIDDPGARLAMGQAAAALAGVRFSPARLRIRHEQIYDEVLS